MHTQERGTRALQFEIEVGGETYRSLVSGLRSLHAPSVPLRASRRTVRALVELDTIAKTFSVSTLGGHRLPRPLRIRTGSETYKNLAHVVSHALTKEERESLRTSLREIIALTSTPPLRNVQIHQGDFELLTCDDPFTLVRRGQLANKRVLDAHVFLELDDAPTLVVPEREEQRISDALQQLQESLEVISPPEAHVTGNFVEITATLSLRPSFNIPINLWIHWGSYEDLTPIWQQEQLTTILDSDTTSEIPLYFRTHIPVHGWYGATFFAQVSGSSERVWIGRPGEYDARFHVASDNSTLIDSLKARFVSSHDSAKKLLFDAFGSTQAVSEKLQHIEDTVPHVSVTDLVARYASGARNENESVQGILALSTEHGYERLREQLTTSYGVGEIVFATPEGPHAAAGGLAQVISGLPPELAQAGVPVSIIAPLYRYENGNKHPSADETLRQGILLGDARVTPHYLGSITVDIGPTYTAGTNNIRRAPSSLPIKVYLAQRGRIRLFLLANNAAFDRLYQPVYADEQLRRSVILSRAVLETIAAEHFGIRPSVIISNDWLTACVPSLFALDQRYRNVPWIATCKTAHMIHNGGADYHGRLPCHMSDEDLWPLFNLAPEHYFGFKDPHREDLINLTMAAVRHATGGVITVSQPYARELLSSPGGDGLEHILCGRTAQLYGVSNGINRNQLSAHLSAMTELSPAELTEVDTLLQAKRDARTRVQSTYGLAEDPQATLVSFVGRLAEQKGLALLSGTAAPTWHSTLEELLLRHNSMQLIIAGPPTLGDEASRSLQETLCDLQRRYPGRVAAKLEYVSHRAALEIMLASSLFLMPSRFEPGGITQLEALAMGTLVVGRNVGGISATIQNYSELRNTGTGFLCDDYSPTAFANTADWALRTIRNQEAYKGLVCRAVSAKHSWSDRTPLFLSVLQDIALGRHRSEQLSITRSNRALLESATID